MGATIVLARPPGRGAPGRPPGGSAGGEGAGRPAPRAARQAPTGRHIIRAMAGAAALRPASPFARFVAAVGALTPTGRARVPGAWALYDFANTLYSHAIV